MDLWKIGCGGRGEGREGKEEEEGSCMWVSCLLFFIFVKGWSFFIFVYFYLEC